MEIKPAKDKGSSNTLAAAKQSEWCAAGLVIGAAVAAAIWLGVPKNVKEQMLPFFATAAGGVGFVMKIGLVKIKDGRLSVGDLHEAVSNYALIPPDQLQALTALKPVIEGNLELHELPQVRSIVDSAISEATKKNEEQKASFEKKMQEITLNAARFPRDGDPESDMHLRVEEMIKAQTLANRRIKPEEVI